MRHTTTGVLLAAGGQTPTCHRRLWLALVVALHATLGNKIRVEIRHPNTQIDNNRKQMHASNVAGNQNLLWTGGFGL